MPDVQITPNTESFTQVPDLRVNGHLIGGHDFMAIPLLAVVGLLAWLLVRRL